VTVERGTIHAPATAVRQLYLMCDVSSVCFYGRTFLAFPLADLFTVLPLEVFAIWGGSEGGRGAQVTSPLTLFPPQRQHGATARAEALSVSLRAHRRPGPVHFAISLVHRPARSRRRTRDNRSGASWALGRRRRRCVGQGQKGESRI